jgi:hypothetical protein
MKAIPFRSSLKENVPEISMLTSTMTYACPWHDRKIGINVNTGSSPEACLDHQERFFIQLSPIQQQLHGQDPVAISRQEKVMMPPYRISPSALSVLLIFVVSRWNGDVNLAAEAFSTTSPTSSFAIQNRMKPSGISPTTLFINDYQKQLEALAANSNPQHHQGDSHDKPVAPSNPMGSYLDSLGTVQFEEAPLQEIASEAATIKPGSEAGVTLVAATPVAATPPPPPMASTPPPPTIRSTPPPAPKTPASVSARPEPRKADSSPTLSITSPTISITLPVGLRPPKLEKPKNILYGEASRKFRRTVYTHDDWERHRSPDRFIRNLASITTSGVYKVRLPFQ